MTILPIVQSLSSVGKESACLAADLGLIPGSGKSPGEGNGNPLQYSCLENPTDRGLATVHGVARARHDLVTQPPPKSFSCWQSHVALLFVTKFTFIKHTSSVENGMATHSHTPAWKIPWTEEPGGLWSMRSQRVGHE